MTIPSLHFSVLRPRLWSPDVVVWVTNPGKDVVNLSVYITVVKCCRIRTDHNEDNTVAIINEWLNHVREEYNDVDLLVNQTETGTAFCRVFLNNFLEWPLLPPPSNSKNFFTYTIV